MTPTEARHGTHSGYVRGCRQDCCRHAHNVYMKLYRMGRRNRIVPVLGTQRRIHALQALGWSHDEISAQFGFGPCWSHDLLRRPTVTAKTALLVVRAYERLAMRLPTPSIYVTRTRNRARSLGWAPPLAWDDIDDPDEKPQGVGYVSRRLNDVRIADEYDAAVVERVLGGEYTVPATVAERRAIVARWPESLAELERNTGWKTERYSERESA